ncbi:Trm112 family protein [Acidisoma sp. C75]
MPADTESLAQAEQSAAEQPVDPRLLEILVCPVSKQPLVYDRARNELISRAAGLAYPIRGGIPIMLADEARVIDG